MLNMLQSSFISHPESIISLSGRRTSSNQISTRQTLEMRIVPCSAVQMSVLAPRKVSAQQWGAYWGVNKMERLQKVLESLLVAYGGAWMSWFLSMLAGNVISSFTGTALIFNWMYAPWLNAKKRNSKVWRTGNQKLSYALYVGRIVSLKRVKRRAGKTIGAVSQEFLVMIVQDERQRELEIVTQWQEPYSKLRLQMRCENMIASSKKDFSILNMVTDSWIPACGVWVGDYPYLDRTAFRDFVSTVEPSNLKGTTQTRPAPRGPTPNSSVEPNARSTRQSNVSNMKPVTDAGRSRQESADRDFSTEYRNSPYGELDSEYVDYATGSSDKIEMFEGFEQENEDTSRTSSRVAGLRTNDVSVSLDWEIYFEEKEAFAAMDDLDNDDDGAKSRTPRDDSDDRVGKSNKKSPSNNIGRVQLQEQSSRTPTPKRRS